MHDKNITSNKKVINLNNKKVIKLTNKKRHIQRNRKIFIFSTSLLIILLFSGTIIKNIYVSNKCSNLLYAVDHYFTNYRNKNLRLIKVESISILSKTDDIIEIEAYGFTYKKPYNKTSLIGTFEQNSKGQWVLKSMSPKSEDTEENTYNNG